MIDLNSSSQEGEIQAQSNVDTNVQPQEMETVKKEDYISLQSDYTRKSQMLKDMSIELAKKDPETILAIKDLKLQNKVINEIYGLSNIQEVKAIYGDEFYKTDSSQDGDELETLKREVKILKNQSESQKIENDIKMFRLANKDLFISEDSEEKLREAIALVSSTVPSSERVKLASAIAFGQRANPTNIAYQSLQTQSVSGGTGSATNESKKNLSSNEKELRKYFGLK